MNTHWEKKMKKLMIKKNQKLFCFKLEKFDMGKIYTYAIPAPRLILIPNNSSVACQQCQHVYYNNTTCSPFKFCWV